MQRPYSLYIMNILSKRNLQNIRQVLCERQFVVCKEIIECVTAIIVLKCKCVVVQHISVPSFVFNWILIIEDTLFYFYDPTVRHMLI